MAKFVEETEKSVQKSEKIEKLASIRGLEDSFQPHPDNYGVSKELFTGERNASIDLLYNTVKKSPELVGCVTAIVEDMIADDWRFIGSASAIEKARTFELKSKFKKILTNAILDLVITGDAYILKLGINQNKLKSIIENVSKQMLEKKYNVKFNKSQVYELISQTVKVPKDLQLLKANTIKMNYDETGLVSSYVQKVNGLTRVYDAGDVIHLTLMNIGGKPNGFTPIESLLSDVATLIFAKDFAGKFFENDGMPYWLINMPEDTPDSRNYENVKKELKEMRLKANKYKSLLTTGKLTIEQVQKFTKDLEFAKLIQHFSQIILMAMGVPAKRINWVVDIRQVGSDPKANEGYYKKLDFMQLIIGETLNAELWDAFNVEMMFKGSYKIDQIRAANVVAIAAPSGLITVEEGREMIGLDPEKPKGTEIKPVGNANITSPAQDKKNAQGKENLPAEQPIDNKLKLMKSFEDILEVEFGKFLLIVEGKVGLGNFDKGNILYLETDEYFVLFFADGNWKYKTKVMKNSVNVDEFRVQRLGNAIKFSI